MLPASVVVAVQSLSCVWLCDPMDCRILYRPLSFGVCSNSCPLNWWYHPTASASAVVFLFCLQSFPASGSFPTSRLFTSKVLELQLQHQSFRWIFRVDFLQDWLVGTPYSPRDSQESSPAPHFLLILCSNSSFNPKHCEHILEDYSKFIYPFVGDVIFFST